MADNRSSKANVDILSSSAETGLPFDKVNLDDALNRAKANVPSSKINIESSTPKKTKPDASFNEPSKDLPLKRSKINVESLNEVLTKKQAIDQGHIYGIHGDKFKKFAEETQSVLIIRELNQQTAARYSENIYSSSNIADENGKSHVIGKGFDIKFKSSNVKEIEGYIPIKNIFSKKEDPEADKKMQAMLNDPEGKYKAVTAEKKVEVGGKEEIYKIYYIQNKENTKSYSFVYEKDGKFYDNPGNITTYKKDASGKYISEVSLASELHLSPGAAKPVETLADKATGKFIIPDYDIAIIGSRSNSNTMLGDKDHGGVALNEVKIINGLKEKFDNMVQHAADNFNPAGYELEMTKEAPYTAFSPDGKIASISSKQEYVDFLNEWRGKGYSLEPSPKTGIYADEQGKLKLSKSGEAFNWKNNDIKLNKMKNAANLASVIDENLVKNYVQEGRKRELYDLVDHLPKNQDLKSVKQLLDKGEYQDFVASVKELNSDPKNHFGEKDGPKQGTYLENKYQLAKYCSDTKEQIDRAKISSANLHNMSKDEYNSGIAHLEDKFEHFSKVYEDYTKGEVAPTKIEIINQKNRVAELSRQAPQHNVSKSSDTTNKPISEKLIASAKAIVAKAKISGIKRIDNSEITLTPPRANTQVNNQGKHSR